MESKDTRNGHSLEKLWQEVGDQFSRSDIESGYTYVYTWLANQFGHFMIGFAGTILAGWLFIAFVPIWGVDYHWHWAWTGTAIVIFWFVLWVLKEWVLDVPNALRDLDSARRQRDALLPDKDKALTDEGPLWQRVLVALRNYYITQYNGESAEDLFKSDVVRDSQMDICCYLAGVFTALAFYLAPRLATKLGDPALTGSIPLLIFVVALIVLLHRSKNWLWANIAFDKAQLPFVSRFVLNARPPNEPIRKKAIAFAKGANKPGHLVIIGPPKSGRTTIAVALGVEALLETQPPANVVVYTTLCKLLDRVAEERMLTKPPEPQHVWPPEQAQLLIVDDVGAEGVDAGGKKKPLLSSEDFKTELRNNKQLRNKCAGKNVIWVVGDDPGQSARWQAALKAAFKKDSQVMAIKLDKPIPRGERLRSARQMARMATYGT